MARRGTKQGLEQRVFRGGSNLSVVDPHAPRHAAPAEPRAPPAGALHASAGSTCASRDAEPVLLQGCQDGVPVRHPSQRLRVCAVGGLHAPDPLPRGLHRLPPHPSHALRLPSGGRGALPGTGSYPAHTEFSALFPSPRHPCRRQARGTVHVLWLCPAASVTCDATWKCWLGVWLHIKAPHCNPLFPPHRRKGVRRTYGCRLEH